MVAERSYAHRDVLDKLGVMPGARVAVEAAPRKIDRELLARVRARAGALLESPSGHQDVDLVLVGADNTTDAADVLMRWRARLEPAGGIWLLTPKRGCDGYVDQRELMLAAATTGLVDNKVCSVSERVSAIRFVVRRRDRGSRTSLSANDPVN